eukprot:CAMPEP_0176044484 /NCGR_PEP_ID=MMETSP0120_2-20121206/22078_1 /TAXON_ID=160619 /ORGANISM="Kryptoperidinium foliaceum, Strain CCMP 1326" /LENGTH=35 /DNA_ID= /DNA_START= /DNA_END= /DNA_ORIENTATION=
MHGASTSPWKPWAGATQALADLAAPSSVVLALLLV